MKWRLRKFPGLVLSIHSIVAIKTLLLAIFVTKRPSQFSHVFKWIWNCSQFVGFTSNHFTILHITTISFWHCDNNRIASDSAPEDLVPALQHRCSKVAGGSRGRGEARVWKYEYQEQDPLMLSAAMEAPELHCVLHDNVILTALSLEYQPSTA